MTVLSAVRVCAAVLMTMLVATCGDNLKGASLAALVVSPGSGLVTTEAGGTASFTVALDSRPFEDTTITLTSSRITEGTVSPATITLTPDNFDIPVTVTLTGVDDDEVADGDQPYMVHVDGGVAGTADVMATNQDDDDPGATVTPTSGLMTTESGSTATFTMKLDTRPSANVTIPISSLDPTEGTVSPAQLVFTPVNYDAPQAVTVTGVNDDLGDGPQPYTISVGVATSTDATYNGFDADNVAVTNIDNDTPGIVVTPSTTPLVTSEDGTSATFTVVLTTEPIANVTIAVSSSDPGEGAASPATLTFTSANWDAPQTVTVTGVNDDLADGSQSYTIVTAPAASSDAGYFGRDAADVAATNVDNDTAGFTVTPATVPLQTTEAGGTATFTVRLNAQPTATVTFAVGSDAPDEGTATPATLTFTTVDWNAPQIVTVTGVDDALADGNQPYNVVLSPAVSVDAGYNGLDPSDVALTNLDNDSAGIVVTAVANLQTTEGGGTVQFTVVLQSQPIANVTIPLTSSDTTEGTVSPAELVFTPVNYNAPQTVTVTGLNDAIVDGNQVYTIVTEPATSLDPGYLGMNAADVTITNLDNDTAGIVVSETAITTGEASGGTATFSIRLLSEPTANVTIALTSSDLTEGTVSPAQLVFTPANFNAPQQVTVTGVDDAIADGNQLYTIVTEPATSTDPAYNNLDGANVTATNVDNDAAAIQVSPTSGLITSETAPGTATFNVVLSSQPTSDVAISVASSRPTEGTTSTTTLVFTPANYNAPQTVTVTGVDDAIADGNQPYTILLGAAVSTDSSYANIDPPDVSVTNLDNDSAGIRVEPASGLVTNEAAAGSDVFTVVLLSQPTADVTIAVSTGDATEGTVIPASLTFTAGNYNVPQTVTVTGVDDAVADGNQPYLVILGPAASADTTYNGLDANDVTVTNMDDDTPGFIIDPVELLLSEFAGDFDTFEVRLTSQPLADVTITLTSSDTTEGTVSPASLTFTPANFATPQLVTVNSVDDLVADGNQVFSIVTGVASSTDAGYAGLNPPDVTVTTVDNETPGVFVQARKKLFTTENGGFTRIRMRLNTQPIADVTCTVSSSDTTEGVVSPQALMFTPANFATLQQITVTGIDDALVDGNQVYTIVTAACTSADPSYNGIDPRDPIVINRDNE